MKTETIYGIHPVFEALQAKRRTFHELCILKDKTNQRIEHIIEIAHLAGIPIQYLPRQKLQSLTGIDTHQGIAARVSSYPLLDLSDLISDNDYSGTSNFFLLIDNIVDPHNLGALIRTALCATLTGVIIPKDRSAEASPTVSKSSAGALEHIRLATVVNMANAIKELKKNNIWIIGLDKDGDRSIYENDFTGNIAMVVGGEESGIRPLIKKNCDFLSFIPQNGPVNSLNASVAGAIAMYEAYRQRHFSN
ncbi:MAG: 23S rRNA (guanosine(2251)-2'-O)-methyltransferase RlmB [Desulfobacteraceae bacterium]|nr:23S rRNA (guanosine(2251)-2'-O)-methyltransferase RlmB [Desulfobacteraceae bacterium]MBC2754558.1 23S rRNA (guanosine(2251)-2'-O)-methyltransferase RlmB [Desulfobacteraceae bacterium]MBC2763777.1 23S rRNA (guanosine(2251)-2'-O)-methyltransferase RlmB [ANME-2 cluster archaeon]